MKLIVDCGRFGRVWRGLDWDMAAWQPSSCVESPELVASIMRRHINEIAGKPLMSMPVPCFNAPFPHLGPVFPTFHVHPVPYA